MATSRDGLVGYDAALTQLRSGVRFPLFVLVLFCLLAPSDAPVLLLLVAAKDLCDSAVPAEVCRGPISFVSSSHFAMPQNHNLSFFFMLSAHHVWLYCATRASSNNRSSSSGRTIE